MTLSRTSSLWLLFHSSVFLAAVQMVYAQPQSLSLEHNSQPLSNHFLLVQSNVGEDTASSVRCLTSRTDCCLPGSAGSDSSMWISPSNVPLEGLSSTAASVEFYRSRVMGGIDLFRRNASDAPREGLYHCEIAANSSTMMTDTVYIGLYLQGNGEQLQLSKVTVPSTSKIRK